MNSSLLNNSEELNHMVRDLEKTLLAKAMELAKKMYRIILEELDALLKAGRDKGLAIAHKRQIWYRTYLGPIRITRRQYRDKHGTYRYLLDEIMGMQKYQHATLGVKEIALELAASMPFRKSAEVLKKTTAIMVSHQTIRQLLTRVAATYLENKEQMTKWFLDAGELPASSNKKVPRLIVEADGVMLSLQREQARKAEVKLGIAYEGWTKVGKDRYGTLNKTMHAAIADSDTFWAGMTLKLHETYDLSAANNIIVGGDGGAWIKDGVNYLGGRFQLCRYHLNRELRYTLGHDNDSIKALQVSLKNEDMGAVMSILAEAKNREKGEKVKEINKLIHYIQSNASGLKDYRRDSSNGQNLRGTGAIEGNIDKLIVRRMKNQGMSWTRKGIRSMLCVRFLVREEKLAEWLSVKTKLDKIHVPIKSMTRIIDKTIKRNYADYFTAGLPALYGVHSSRPWVKLLKSLTEVTI